MRPYEVGGIGAVNPTPYNRDGSINEGEYRRHIRWLSESGVRFIQPSAATGQSMHTSLAEYKRLLEISVDEVGTKTFVTAYPGRPDTGETIERIRIAEDVGAHGAFVIQPFYCTPDDEGIYLYYRELARATKLPLVFYNNPGRAVVPLSIDVMDRLTDEYPNFVGLKQSDTELFPASVLRLGKKIKVMPKWEFQILFGLALGSPGVITVSANIIPQETVQIMSLWQSGKHEAAKDLYLQWLPLFEILHVEPLPNAVHYILNRMGWNFGRPRLPARDLSEVNAKRVDAVLSELGLLQSSRAAE